jgi:hypothetical protein
LNDVFLDGANISTKNKDKNARIYKERDTNILIDYKNMPTSSRSFLSKECEPSTKNGKGGYYLKIQESKLT